PSILFDAIDTDQFELVELMLQHGADPAPTRHRCWVTDSRYRALAKKYGFQIRASDAPKEKWPALIDACRGNHNAPDDVARLAPFLGRKTNLKIRDYKGRTALHRAGQAGFIDIPTELLKHGADLEAASPDGETPIFDAAFHGRPRTVELFAQQGANLEAKNKKGETPLFAAIRGADAETVNMLIQLGADLSATNNRGETPKQFAARCGRAGIEEVRKLLRRR
ncbi:MAG: ankyrin repeat domain-containing protein, partial [Verrucomicrobiota bacterium]